MMKVEDSCGLAQLKASRKASLNQPSHHHNLLPSNSPPCRSHLSRLHLLLTLNAVNSPSCSVIWSILPDSLPSSIPKTIVKSSVPINQLVRKSSSDTMGFSCTLGIPKRTKMTHTELYIPG